MGLRIWMLCEVEFSRLKAKIGRSFNVSIHLLTVKVKQYQNIIIIILQKQLYFIITSIRNWKIVKLANCFPKANSLIKYIPFLIGIQIIWNGLIRIYNNCETMQNIDYLQLAKAINSSNNLQAYNSFYSFMGEPSHIDAIFNSLYGNHDFLFISCEMLSRRLNNKQFEGLNDEIELKHLNSEESDKRKKVLEKVIRILMGILLSAHKQLPSYIVNSIVNTISVCIKTMIINYDSVAHFVQILGIIEPSFIPQNEFIKPNGLTNDLVFIETYGMMELSENHQFAVKILISVLQYITRSAYFKNYYYYRRNIYTFRNTYLPYLLNYAIFSTKILFKAYRKQLISQSLKPQEKKVIYNAFRPSFQLLEMVIMYPFSLNMHEGEVQDEIHDNISGTSTEIYFPSYCRNFLCDANFLTSIVNYYTGMVGSTTSFQAVSEDLYCLIRIIGRALSASDYVFVNQEERKHFRSTNIQFVIDILLEDKFYDTYLIMCISKINTKIVKSFTSTDFIETKQLYYQTLMNYTKKVMNMAPGKIQDGEKHPIRQCFDLLVAMMNNSRENVILEIQVKGCAEDVLELFFQRLTDNKQNERMFKEFGINNHMQVECFSEIFQKVPLIFNANLLDNIKKLQKLNISQLNEYSVMCWLHLASLLLPNYDPIQEQTDLVIKFFYIAIDGSLNRSIASLNYIKQLISQILMDIEDGISSTYLWKFMQSSLNVTFQVFLTQIINYTVSIFMVPNFTLIESALDLFKATFTKLCKIRHRSFKRYFDIVENVSKEIDSTMLAQQEYMKLRIDYFSVISMIWINEGHIGFVYRIISNIRESLGKNNDKLHFMRYLTDLTGILQPVQSHEIFKTLVQLILLDLQTLLPLYLANQEAVKEAFSDEFFLRAFVKFVLILVNDQYHRISTYCHSNLPFRIQDIFKPYLNEVLKYDYPKKTVELWMKFIKLNPLGQLLPFNKSLKEKNNTLYRPLLRQYFDNLHRLRNLEDFYFMYGFIEDSIEFMIDWWEQIMNRGQKPDINLRAVVQSRIWTTKQQKQLLGKLLYRISLYNPTFWALEVEASNENKYANWFITNFH